jgi:hypothetical protein
MRIPLVFRTALDASRMGGRVGRGGGLCSECPFREGQTARRASGNPSAPAFPRVPGLLRQATDEILPTPLSPRR